MRVLYFHQHFSTPKGSAGTRSYEMAVALLRRGHQVTMVCGSYAQGKTGLTGPFVRGRRRGIVDGIDVIELDLRYGNELSFLRRSLLFLRYSLNSIGIALRKKCDVIFATTTPLTAGIPGIFGRWFRRKPFVFEVRDLWPELPRAMGVITNPLVLSGMSILEWTSYRSATRLIGLSPGIVDGITRRGVATDRIAMIPNGCDLELFSPDAEAWRPAEVIKDDFLAVFTGTHGIANGLNAVLDAACVLKQRGRNGIKITLVGQGREKENLIARATRESLDNVIFLDPVPKTKLAGLLAGADLGLQILQNVPAFYYGTSPNKFFDYIAAGLPVLNNYPGWLADLIESGSAGFAVAPADPGAFADALEEACDNPDTLGWMGANARRMAEDTFSRERLARQFVDWLEVSALS